MDAIAEAIRLTHYREFVTVRRLAWILCVVNRRAGDAQWRILDAGCGSGPIAIAAARLGHDVVGIDFDERCVSVAEEICPSELSCKFQVADVTSRDLPQKLQTRFDCVILSDVIEHVPRPDQLLSNMRSLVKDNGVLVCTTVNGYQASEIAVRALRATRTYGIARKVVRHFTQPRQEDQCALAASAYPGLNDPGHVQFFGLNRLNALFRDAGFRVEESHFRGTALGLGAFGPLRSQLLQRFDDWLGKVLPPSMTSAWYFVARPVRLGGV